MNEDSSHPRGHCVRLRRPKVDVQHHHCHTYTGKIIEHVIILHKQQVTYYCGVWKSRKLYQWNSYKDSLKAHSIYTQYMSPLLFIFQLCVLIHFPIPPPLSLHNNIIFSAKLMTISSHYYFCGINSKLPKKMFFFCHKIAKYISLFRQLLRAYLLLKPIFGCFNSSICCAIIDACYFTLP